MTPTRRHALGALAVALALAGPRPAQAFWNPFKKLESVIQKMAAMNQGATVKERWANLVNAGGGAAAPGESSWEATAPAAPGDADLRASNDLSGIRDLLSTSIQEAHSLEGHDARSLALGRLLDTWKQGLEMALSSGDSDGLELLWGEGAGLFSLDPVAAHRAVLVVGSRHPGGLSRELGRRAGRMLRASRFHGEELPTE